MKSATISPNNSIGLSSHFSAATATIMFADQEVGELQNVTIEEGYDLKALSEVGSNFPIIFIPGVFRGVVRAQKGIIDTNEMINKILPFSSQAAIEDYISSISQDRANVTGFMSINDSLDFFASQYEESLKDKSHSYVYAFNVEVKNIDGEVFQKLEDCVINTRRISIGVGNLIVLQDVEMFYRKRTV